VLLELIAVLTVASVVYNAATADRVKPATALYAGPFVHVNGKLLAYRRWGARDTPIILLGGFIRRRNFGGRSAGVAEQGAGRALGYERLPDCDEL
jgi:hypothetical protein